MKKFLALCLSLALLVSLVPSALADINGAGKFPITDGDPIKLTIAIPVYSNVEDIETNKLTLYIEQMAGVDLEFVPLSVSDTAAQINLMMTNSDLPDAIIGYSFSYDQICSFADAGKIIPLDEYIESQGYYLNNFVDAWIAKTGINPMAYATYNNHAYSLPSGGGSITTSYGGYYVRLQTQFLDALGMDMPHTLDEFYNYLVAVRDNDVNGNGDPNDEIPFASCVGGSNVDDTWLPTVLRTIGNAYQYTDTLYFLKVNDGKVSFVANNELYKETIEFIKKLVDENLLDPASFTQDSSVLATTFAEEGTQFGAISTGYNKGFLDKKSDEYFTRRLMPNLEGPYGYKSTMYKNEYIQTAMVITSACENPEAMFKIFDWFLSDEAAVLFRYGFEGEQWEKASEGEMGNDGNQAWYRLLTGEVWSEATQNVIWRNELCNYAIAKNHVVSSDKTLKYSPSADIVAWDYLGELTYEWFPQVIMSTEDSAEFEELRSLIQAHVLSNFSQFALGYRSMDEWDQYCSELESMGVERFVEIAQNAVDAIQ